MPGFLLSLEQIIYGIVLMKLDSDWKGMFTQRAIHLIQTLSYFQIEPSKKDDIERNSSEKDMRLI